jgi:hypothetical protein
VVVKRDCEELFGLEIAYRRGFEFNLYDFEIESFMSLAAFKRISGLDTENFESCKAFFDNHSLFFLNQISQENPQEWQRKSGEFINSSEEKWNEQDEIDRLTISINTIRG